MTTPLIPQEIYLLERYSSVPYFDTMRAAWLKMLDIAETALADFVNKLPADYRSRPLAEQPDVVWGERVLPNFRKTRESLDEAYIRLTNSDLTGLGVSHSIKSDIRGQTVDYPADWMGQDIEKEFYKWQHVAGTYASNIAITERSGWYLTDLSKRYDEPSRGTLDAPSSWPLYRLQTAVRVKSEDIVKTSGIYLPDCESSCASLLISGYEAFEAEVGYNEVTTHSLNRVPTTWTLVERIADAGGGIPGDTDALRAGVRIRVMGGQVCQQSGYYFTPAQTNSRRHFKQGDTMPSLGGDYGLTIWQWDEVQS
jgi:hypothetical protein